MSSRRSASDKREKPPIPRKLVAVGDHGCGKTTLLYAISRREFVEYFPMVRENLVVDVTLKETGQPLQLSLCDTGGHEGYKRLRPLSYPDTDLVLICFAMSNRDSFENVRDVWVPEIAQFCPKAALILVGCKSDLESRVEEAEVRKMAEEMKASASFVCSAKEMRGIGELLDAAAETASRVELRRRRGRWRGLDCFGCSQRK